jgi:hypothetical protein
MDRELMNKCCPALKENLLGDFVSGVEGSIWSLGKKVYWDPTNGSDGNDGSTYLLAKKTFDRAYELLEDGKNQILVYIAGTSSHSFSEAFTWSKSYTHMVGLCSPVGVGNRARFFQLSTATGVSSMFTVSGSGCIFKDLYFFQGVADATSLVDVEVTGQRNYFENVHFAGIGNATMSATGCASLKINGGAENTFVNCMIGLDTIARDDDAREIIFDGAATRNSFIDCMIYGYVAAGQTGYSLVKVQDSTGIDRFQIFNNCIFMTDSENRGVTIASVFDIPAGIVQGKIILKDCMMLTDGASGSGDWDSNDRGTIWNNSVAPTAAAAGGIATKQ